MKQICKTKKSGFSLVEALVALFIFSLVSVMIAGSFSSFFKSYVGAKKTQRNIENVQYAMNLMAKTLRTSGLVTTTLDATNPLDIFDYSRPDHNCIRYRYSGNKLQTATTTDVNPTNPAACNWASIINPDSYSDLTSAVVNTTPVITATASSGANKGKITISLQVQGAAADFPIQMTVSLRQ